MEKATIYDYARMCIAENKCCRECPLSKLNTNENLYCAEYLLKYPDKANEIILKWCEEHPIKTRQDEFLKMFPNARIDVNGALSICPKCVNKDFSCQTSEKRCISCCKEYWLAEVDENDRA